MKKIYQRPLIEVIQVKQEYNLLAGSPGVKVQVSVEEPEEEEEELWLEEESSPTPAKAWRLWDKE